MQALASDDVVKARTEVTRRITHLGRQGKPKQAISELTQLAKMGIQPDTQAATALVSACTTNRNMEMAMNVFEELFGVMLQAAGAFWMLESGSTLERMCGVLLQHDELAHSRLAFWRRVAPEYCITVMSWDSIYVV